MEDANGLTVAEKGRENLSPWNRIDTDLVEDILA